MRIRKEEITINIHIGKRLRHARLMRELSQEALAEKIGVSCQQLQKYEKGANRVSSSTLYTISNVLQLPFDYFFEGLYTPEIFDPDFKFTAQKVELLKRFEALSGEKQKVILRIICCFSGNS